MRVEESKVGVQLLAVIPGELCPNAVQGDVQGTTVGLQAKELLDSAECWAAHNLCKAGNEADCEGGIAMRAKWHYLEPK
ncbi:hypothetical protein HaLaN_09823 [Haematococcus lacustris]|uniref:Uncharacterized protein n=1 Tax=Haematococcus lacustris TaxID=44745 RepID=A0A699YXA3_HAELA|nr:hypothetical protein HaLaN_09823 [Haematococcus lacustris]